ncbi:uncharacterized protein BXZ73DRAFT_52336, partial [Epithele typhae]|uniref:uncharacterized protein n=1 Tax=Epithele typhae TaxID=378194 RepID=UPI0020074D18
LYVFDYIITFDREVDFVWGKPLGLSSVLFLLNRYSNLFLAITETFNRGSFHTVEVICSCAANIRLNQLFLIFTFLVVTFFATLRVYASWARDWRPALPVLILGLVQPAMSLVRSTSARRSYDSLTFALVWLHLHSPFSIFRVLLTAQSANIAYDMLALILLFAKTAAGRRSAMSFGYHTNLAGLVLRDGERRRLRDHWVLAAYLVRLSTGTLYFL